MGKTLSEFLTDLGLRVDAYDWRRSCDARTKWWRSFAVNSNGQTYKQTYGGMYWHIFSYGQVRCLSGAKAAEAYRAMGVDEFLAFTSNDAEPVLVCEGPLPCSADVEDFVAEAGVPVDVYLSDIECRWTMVFTHEGDSCIGPFFSRKDVES
jgi:hypothetical protein